MELIILSYNNEQKGELKVESNYGKFNVLWDGELPSIGERVDVELDIDNNLTWDKDIYLAKNDELQIQQTKEKTVIQGRLEEVSNDGFTVLRLSDSIITFVAKGLALPINSIIQIKVSNIKAYPTNY